MMSDERLLTLQDRIETVLRDEEIVNSKITPSIVVERHGDNSGLVKAQAIINDDVSRMLREKTREKLENDVFLLNCSGYFTMEPRFMSLGCSVVNEDGIPVDDAVETSLPLIMERADNTRNRIIEMFRGA